jgi:DNA repair protein RecO (recombination protein O)
MAEFQTPALVLRTFDQGESDRLVHLYSLELGRVSVIAKGARRSRRRFPGTLEILNVVQARIAESRRSSWLRLDGARLEQSFDGLVSPLGRYASACVVLELLDRFTGEREPHPQLYRFAVGALEVVRAERPDRLLALLLWLKTLAWLGYAPQLARCGVCSRELARGGEVGFDPRHGGAVCRSCAQLETNVAPRVLLGLAAGIRRPLAERASLGLSERDVQRAEGLVAYFFRFHLGTDLRCLAFLQHVLPLGHGDASAFASASPDAEPPSQTLDTLGTLGPGATGAAALRAIADPPS